MFLKIKITICLFDDRRDTPMDGLAVHLGDYDLSANNETEHQARKVSRVMFHSHFHPFLLTNDVALLQLDRPAAIGKTVRPVCLPTAGGKYIKLYISPRAWEAHQARSQDFKNGVGGFEKKMYITYSYIND